MWKTQITVLLAMVVCLDQIQGDDPSTGKCETGNLVPVQIPLERFNFPLLWKVVYSIEFKFLKDEICFVTRVGETNFTVVCNVTTWANRLPQIYEYDLQVTNDIWYESPRGFTDPARRYIKYVLGVTPSLALYVYRCSESGVPGEYQRIIKVPAGVTPPAEKIQTLLDIDRTTFGNDKGILGCLC